MLGEVRSYREWNIGSWPPGVDDHGRHASTSCRRSGTPYRVFTPDEAVEHVRTAGYLGLHPLCGGIPPEVAWTSLELLRTDVLPQLT